MKAVFSVLLVALFAGAGTTLPDIYPPKLSLWQSSMAVGADINDVFLTISCLALTAVAPTNAKFTVRCLTARIT